MFPWLSPGPDVGRFASMTDEHTQTTPAWVEKSTLAAPALLGAAAGLMLSNLMHPTARRGLGIGFGALAIVAMLPVVVGGVTSLITGPKSRVGVRRRIQRIRDAGIGAPDYDEVDAELREQGLL